MFPIENIDTMDERLSKQNPNWQEELYNKIGVYCEKRPNYYQLYTACGSIDLEYETESPAECEFIINTVDDLAIYITQMQAYKTILSDEVYGNFKKSEVFLHLLYNVIIPTTAATHKKYKDESEHLSLYNIEDLDNTFTVYFAFDERDGSYESFEISDSLTLEQVINTFADSLKATIQSCNIAIEVVVTDDKVEIPDTLEKLKSFAELL